MQQKPNECATSRRITDSVDNIRMMNIVINQNCTAVNIDLTDNWILQVEQNYNWGTEKTEVTKWKNTVHILKWSEKQNEWIYGMNEW